MSTIVAVIKDKKIAIAADSQTSFGNLKQRGSYVENPDKIFKWGKNLLAVVGYAANGPIIESMIKNSKRAPSFKTRQDIFEFFRKFHNKLKKDYFLRPEEDEEDPYESSRMDILIANNHGIFSILSLREVWQYKHFWSLGSGSPYALGAMHQVFNQSGTSAAEVAEAGIAAGIEFDINSGAPIQLEMVKK